MMVLKQSHNFVSFFISDDINENEFPEYIGKLGFNCIRFNIDKIGFARQFIKLKVFEHMNLGYPDFFIWKGREHYFCEFKSKNDLLHSNQINWLLFNSHLPYALAKVIL